MQFNNKVRLIKKFVEITAEELAAKELSGSLVGSEFSLHLALGDKSSSEIVSFLKALHGAVSKFDEELIGSLQFTLAISSPTEQELNQGIDARMNTVLELERNQPKLISAK